MKTVERNTNIELLRFFLMVSILIWHIIVHGYNLEKLGCDDFFYSGNIPVTFLLSSFTLPATYCFVFISGYFGINLKIKRLIELVLCCLVVSVCLVLIKKYIFSYEVNMREVWDSFFPITNHKWWFMTAYIQLLILSPFLNAGMDNFSKSSKIKLLVLIYGISFFILVSGKPNSGCTIWGIIFMYLLGRYLKVYANEVSPSRIKKVYLISFLILFCILLGGYYFFDGIRLYKGQKILMIFISYINPLIVLMAVCMFYVVLQWKTWCNPILNKVLSANFFIYLLTEGFLDGWIYKQIVEVFKMNTLLGIASIVCVLLSCLFIGLFIQTVISFCVEAIQKTLMSSKER